MKPSVLVFFIVSLVICAAGCAPVSRLLSDRDEVVRVSGEDAAISGFVLPAKESFEEENSGVKISIIQTKPGTELVDLDRGVVDVVVSVQSLNYLLNAAAEEKVVIDPTKLEVVEVGKNDTVIFLNMKNSIKKLTRKQLKGIFSGKITNWKQLNGANRGIIVYLNSASEMENELFIKDIVGNEPIASKQFYAQSFEEVRKLVMDTPGAIGIAPSGYIAGGVNVPKSPRASSPVIVVTKGKPSPTVKKFTDILKDMDLLQ
jgi:phosphate transport system substrate-binding protein